MQKGTGPVRPGLPDDKTRSAPWGCTPGVEDKPLKGTEASHRRCTGLKNSI